MRLTIWMNMPSPYQADFFRELGGRPGVELEVIFGRSLDPMRTDLGWNVSNHGFRSQSLPSSGRTSRALRRAWERRDQVHVINGVWALPEFVAAAITLMAAGAPVFYHAEAPDPRTPRSGLRLGGRNLVGGMLLRRSHGIFAISRMAERFYAGLTNEPNKVFPFGYFKRHEFVARSREQGEGREVLFVGQLIERKGVELLLRAFAQLPAEAGPAGLTFVGTGPREGRLRELAAELGIAGRVRFEGTVDSGRIDERIRRADVLVLPSHFDGWGIVVNEALAAGVPVVVSGACGAADLVGEGGGGIFPAGDAEALRDRLGAVLQWPQSRRPAPSVWSERIGLGRVTDYFLACLAFGTDRTGGKPLAPWRDQGPAAEDGKKTRNKGPEATGGKADSRQSTPI